MYKKSPQLIDSILEMSGAPVYLNPINNGAPHSSVGSARDPCAEGSAADPGSTPGPGPFAACHSPSLTLLPVQTLQLLCQ